MDTKQENDNISILYKNFISYLEQENNNLNQIIADYNQLSTKSVWVDILGIFLKYPNSMLSKYRLKILKDTLRDKKFNFTYFLESCINILVDYYSYESHQLSNKEDLIKYWKKNNISVFRIFLSFIINDGYNINNYREIEANFDIINNFYKEYLDTIFNNFLGYCRDYIINKKINIMVDYIIRLFNFISDTRNETIDDKLFKSISRLFFKTELNGVIPVLEDNLKNYIEKDKIIKNIFLFFDIQTQEIKLEICDYLIFIETLNGKIEPQNKNFLLIFFEYLNENQLINFFNNNKNENIKNYDLGKLINIQNTNIIKENLINYKNNDEEKENNNIIYEEKKETQQNKENEEIENNKEIEMLKNNLKPKTIKKYFEEQIKKYSKIYNNKNKKFYLAEIINSKTINNILDYSINNNYFPLVNEIFLNLKQMINNLYKNYPGKNIFGFVVINEKEYIYTFNNDDIIDRFLLNAKNIKKSKYLDLISDNKSLSSFSNYSETIENKINLNDKESNSTSSKISNKSNKANRFSNEFKFDKILSNTIEYDVPYFKAPEFENNVNHLFRSIFDLDILPNFFFPISINKNSDIKNKYKSSGIKNEYKSSGIKSEYKSSGIKSSVIKNKYKRRRNIIEYKSRPIKNIDINSDESQNKQYLTFSEYNSSLFYHFLEADGAYINKSNNKIAPNLNSNICPFYNHRTFYIKNKKGKYFYEEKDEDLYITKKSIIITESKLSIPKQIEDFSFDIQYFKKDLDKTLIFTLNKLIRKIDFYSQYAKYEILEEEEDIKNYSFQLFLLYNNIPIDDLEEIIKENLKLLIDNNYIKNEFILKIMYFGPNLGTYNINKMQKEFNNLKNNFKRLEKNNIDLKNELNEMKKREKNNIDLKHNF